MEAGQLLQWASSAPPQATFDTLRAIISVVLIGVVLIWLSAIYRGGSGDDEIERPVELAILPDLDDGTIAFAPRHLSERSTHNAKAPRIVFFLQVPGAHKYAYRALLRPLKIQVRLRNSLNVFDHSANVSAYAPGGQIGIDSETRKALEDYFGELYRKEGRRFDADTATFVLRLKYPSSANLDYLLREHPDISVRVGAWIFILTSIFTVFQELIMRAISTLFFGGMVS